MMFTQAEKSGVDGAIERHERVEPLHRASLIQHGVLTGGDALDALRQGLLLSPQGGQPAGGVRVGLEGQLMERGEEGDEAGLGDARARCEDNSPMLRTFQRAGWVKEAHYRRGWPVEGGEPVASVAYAMLRQDWENGTTTPVPWE